MARDALHAHPPHPKNVFHVKAAYFSTIKHASQVGIVLRGPLQIAVIMNLFCFFVESPTKINKKDLYILFVPLF